MFPIFIFAAGIAYVAADCQNYGLQNGSSCACPIGFGGSDCSQPACGGNIFQSDRAIASLGSSAFANLTADGCTCEENWTGTGCNVCQTASACQSAYAGAGYSTSSSETGSVVNTTLVCNNQGTTYAASQMSCSVDNAMLEALFPLSTTLNIMRTLDPSLSPLPNVTSFGSSGTVYAQLFYEGVEQFYCNADTCAQTVDNSAATWECQNLECTCITNTSFCGAVTTSDLTQVIDSLDGTLTVNCDATDNSTGTATCSFQQTLLDSVFGSSGLSLQGCAIGECVRQDVIDNDSTESSASVTGKSELNGGVIAGLAVVGTLVLLVLLLLGFGMLLQRKARRAQYTSLGGHKASVVWDKVSYVIPGSSSRFNFKRRKSVGFNDDKVVLDNVCGSVRAGQMMAILGPSGAGKTTLIEILAKKEKSGTITGLVSNPCDGGNRDVSLRIGFVPQQDVLPPMLTVYEALLFAARLRLPEGISDEEKRARVDRLMDQLGISPLRNVRIGFSGESGGGRGRGISGGEMRRVTIGLELIACPDVLILDEPTSGLDSVSAAKIANVLHAVAHDAENPIAIIASIHQPSSRLYQSFDSILLLSHGRALYSGPGSFAPAEYFANTHVDGAPAYQQGYNVADYLLEIASDPPVGLFQLHTRTETMTSCSRTSYEELSEKAAYGKLEPSTIETAGSRRKWYQRARTSSYTTTFFTQIEYLSGREWKLLCRDKTLFLAHFIIAAILGAFCGGLYYNTGTTIAGFQSRVGCLFFLGSLVAFSSLSALYNIVEIRPLFLRERSSSYYSPASWLLSRFLYDVIPLRLIPTIVVSTITYWMCGLAADAAHFFKFLFILVLYSLAITQFNFLLGTLFRNGGIAILVSALSALYQMTFAGFFVHLDSIPPVLRWLQWLCPLKYCLEALSVNEVGAGLMISDSLEGVPVDVSASLIMTMLFNFGSNNYYRDVLVLFAFIAGLSVMVIGVVWLKVRERR